MCIQLHHNALEESRNNISGERERGRSQVSTKILFLLFRSEGGAAAIDCRRYNCIITLLKAAEIINNGVLRRG